MSTQSARVTAMSFLATRLIMARSVLSVDAQTIASRVETVVDGVLALVKWRVRRERVFR